MGIPAFTGCTKGSYCSDQQATKVGNNQTQIYHRTVTTLTGQGPSYSGSKTETYIIKPNAAGVDTWVLAATSTDGGKTQTFTSAAGEDLKKSMAPGGNMYKNTQKQVQDTLTKGGAKQGLVTLPGTSGSLEKINPEQQKALGITSPNTGQVTSEQISATAGKEVEGTRNEFPGAKGSDPLRYPINLKSEYQDVIKFKMVKYTPKKFSQTTFGFGSRNLAGSNDRQIIGTVVLPIPAGISDTNAVSWAGQDMNALEAAGANLALSGIEGGGDKMAATAENIAKTVSGASADVQKSLAAAIAGQAVGVQGILARTTGLINNPNMELLFQAPTLRPFTFNFKLSARSDKEAQEIRSIIRFFKQGMSPIRTQSQLFLKAPHTFQLEYLHRNKSHSYLNKFKECALQSFSVNYTPENQYATFTDGAMVSYLITMQFQELEPVFNDDYGNASNAPDIEIGY